MVHLYLIRHAESENNARPEHERVEDPAITARGIQQSESLANWLATHAMDVLLTSPFRRALQTVAPVAHGNSVKVEVWGDIFERGGCYRGWREGDMQGAPGMGHDEILSLVPNAVIEPEIPFDGWWGGKPRETDAQTFARANSIRAKIERRFAKSAERVAVVTHAEFQRVLLGRLLDQHDIRVEQLGPICNAGVTYVSFSNDRWQLQWFNAVTHIPSPLITGAKG
jgi:2,3-bisphosphoglycerate-dependent phosphoglycerate mutase